MKYVSPVSLLALLAISLSYPTSTAAVDTSVVTQIAQSTSSPKSAGNKQAVQSQNVYRSAKFGFRFGYPNTYIVDSSKQNQRPKPGQTLQGTIDIWKKNDYQAIKSKNFEGGEYPPNISIAVHSNSNRLRLSQWKDRLSIGTRNTRNIKVAGQNALAYASTGLYESDNVVLCSPDGRRAIHLSVGYINASDPSRQAFQKLVSSFKFGT